ncbi:unnamed protein product [Ophioblennius macclurei]
MASTRTLVWTDDEVELLLRVTLDYKNTKSQENIYWESCQSKYYDIYREYVEQYPACSQENGKDFPHESVITKAQVTSKLKCVRGKYRQAVDSGRRNGHGRVVLIYYDLCQQIWGGPPSASSLEVGLETADLRVGVSDNTATTSRSSTPLSEFGNGITFAPICSPDPPEVVRERRDIVQIRSNLRGQKQPNEAKLTNHRKDRLKRRGHWESAVDEDLRLKRRIVDILEESERRNNVRLDQIAQNVSTITETIKEGFSILCTMMQQQSDDGKPREVFKTESEF